LPLGDASAGTANDGGEEGKEGEGVEAAGAGAGADASASASASAELERSDPEAAVDQLLDWLSANKYLSETRFIESRVNARARKQGGMMIRLELSRHGLTMEPEQAAALRETEFARAQAIWQRKFGEVAVDARDRARQGRFLAARGFAADVVRRIVGGDEEY
jgi:regulatory protein